MLMTSRFREFQPEERRHFGSYSIPFTPKVLDTTHVSVSFGIEDVIANHLRMVRKQRMKNSSFKMLDEDYSTVVSYLGQAFKRKASLHASDVADALGMDYGTVREIIAQLIDEGKLKVK